MDARNATLLVVDPLNFEATPNVSLFLSVTTNVGNRVNSTASLVLQNTNDPPVFRTTPPSPFTVSEAAAVGTVLATFAATDEDNDVLTYSLSGGAGDGVWLGLDTTDVLRLDPSSGALSVAAPLDFERRRTMTVTVTVSDRAGGAGASATVSLALSVLDTNDVAVASLRPSQLSTRGGETLTLSGSNLGALVSPGTPSNASISVTYGPPSSPATYVATGCSVSRGNEEVTCSSVPGVGGSDLVWTLCVGGGGGG